MDVIQIPSVNERDIDLLMLEEFLATPDFGVWFASQIFGEGCCPGRCISALRSVTQSSGESDLEVEYMADDGTRTLFLIENKIGAGLQPQQARRDLERGSEFVDSGGGAAADTIIVAPSRYFASEDQTKGFNFRLSYESLRDWFDAAMQLGARRNFKIALLNAGIEKGTLGYQPVTDAPVTLFWQAYWRLLLVLAPELEMPAPEAKPSRSGFISMRPPALKSLGADIVHKVNKGRVDLQLRKLGEHANAVRKALDPLLEEDMSVERATGSVAIRINVPKMSTLDSFASQESEARLGIAAAKRLMEWCLKFRNEVSDARRALQAP
jgi:hypothetical protein